MSKQFAVIVGITFFVGMIWLIADIVFNTKASIPISPKLEALLEPLNPNFNSRVLEIVDKETLDRTSITITAPVVPSPSPDEFVVPLSSPEPSETASTSADLDI